MISDRIHQARLSANLTLKQLGELVGVSHTAINKYEKGLLTPSSSILYRLARACNVRTEYFFRTHHIELISPEFRKFSAFGKKAEEALLIRVKALVEQRIALFNAFPELPFALFQVPKSLPDRITAMDDVEEVADRLREIWQLGFNPIAHLTDILEEHGLLVIDIEEKNPKFSGMTAIARTPEQQEFIVIVVSNSHDGDRQRFTLAHELGHLILKGKLAENLDLEKACDRFAGAFIAPRIAVKQSLGEYRHALEWQELYALKHEYGLSMMGWLFRAKQCQVIDHTVYDKLVRQFSARHWRTKEPWEPLPQETPQLFKQLVYRALAEQHISEEKAAELLDMPMMQFHKVRFLEQS